MFTKKNSIKLYIQDNYHKDGPDIGYIVDNNKQTCHLFNQHVNMDKLNLNDNYTRFYIDESLIDFVKWNRLQLINWES